MSTDAAAKLAAADQQAAALSNVTTLDQLNEIARRFNSHQADEHQQQRMAMVRLSCMQTAEAIVSNCLPSRERATALTLLEQVMFEANAGISRPPQTTAL